MSELLNVLIPAGNSMKDLLIISAELADIFNRRTPASYDVFVKQIDKDINNIISVTESGRQHHLNKGEDAITEHIIVQLKRDYSSVHHDAQHGGHCDIYIETKGSDGSLYKWIMEAKLWKGIEYVYGGINNCKGGMIFYSQLKSGALYAMDEWHKGLEAKGIIINNKRKDGLRFDTEHKLNAGIGADFFVSHYCVDLYHNPTVTKLKKAQVKADNAK